MKKIRGFLIIIIFISVCLTNINVYATLSTTAKDGGNVIIVGQKIDISLSSPGTTSIEDIKWESSDSTIIKCTPYYQTSYKNVHGTKVEDGQEPSQKTCIEGLRIGDAEISVTYKKNVKGGGTLNGSDKIKITVLPDMQTEYTRIPPKEAKAKEIKYFILSDEEYNQSKALKDIANTDKEKIQAWYNTIDEFIETDNYHYSQEDQFGSTKEKLSSIIDAYSSIDSNGNEGQIDTAIESVDTSGATDLMESTMVSLVTGIKSDEGKSREPVTFTDVFDNLDNLDEYAKNESNDGTSEFTTKINVVLTIITNIGMIVAVLMSAIIGLKYMIGSVEEKAEYKKDMIPYLVGAALIFGICAIVKVLQELGQSINNI